MDNSVKIEPTLLSETLLTLKKDNEKIDETIKSINKLLNELDDTKWKAPEKEKIDTEIIPYLEYQKKNIFTGLNNCILVIEKARENYIATNGALTKVAETLENYSNGGDVK